VTDLKRPGLMESGFRSLYITKHHYTGKLSVHLAKGL